MSYIDCRKEIEQQRKECEATIKKLSEINKLRDLTDDEEEDLDTAERFINNYYAPSWEW